MKILVLGGTRFLGRHLVESALSHGHTLTLFNRGQTNPELFPQVQKLHGDREKDISVLTGKTWDVVVDVNGYVPSAVRQSSQLLADCAAFYVFVSTVSVYADYKKLGIDENHPLATLTDEDAVKIERADQVNGANYGALKALCEREVTQAFGDHALVVRPGLIVGPHDPSDRFTYWVRRLSQGGDALAPNTPDMRMQFIDARDLVAWMIRMIDRRQTGVFNATGPNRAMTFGELLETCIEVGANKTDLIWVDEAFIRANDLAKWEALPLWMPSDAPNYAGFYHIDIDRAVAAGLDFRPLSDTVRDTLAWDRLRGIGELKMGLSREREEEFLARVKNE
jgi:2'-hydroxyisoflavone reductase